MLSRQSPRIPLPKGWTRHVRSAVLHVISLAQYAAVYSPSWAVNSVNGRVSERRLFRSTNKPMAPPLQSP